MADKALAKRPANELAAPNATAGMAWEMEGEDRDDFLIPRVIVHQGDIAEKWYGQHEKGTLLDTSTKEKLPSDRFIPLVAYKEWIAWGDDLGQPPLYVTRNKTEIDPADLEWNETTPPKATAYRNFVVIFDGMTTPVVLSMSDAKKAQRNAGKLLHQLEKTRGASGRGYYTLGVIDCENKKGKWKDVTVQPIKGEPPAELSELAAKWIAALSQQTIKTNIVESAQAESEAAGGFDPDA